MTLKKELSRRDFIALLLCIAFPPAGYFLAYRNKWIHLAVAWVASIAWACALYGMIVSGYPARLNDVLVLGSLWGLVMTIPLSGKYLQANKPGLTRVLLLLVLVFFILAFIPWQSLSCFPACAQITLHTLRGEVVTLLSGWPLMVFFASLAILFGVGAFLAVRHEAR